MPTGLRIARVILAVIALLLGTFCGVLPLSLALTASERIADDKASYADFRRAAAYVEQFRAVHHRLPGKAGFVQFVAHTHVGQPIELAYQVTPDPRDRAPAPFDGAGRPPPGGYFLSYWRGEWVEYYASWSGETTLLTDSRTYWQAFGAQAAGMGILALILIAAACWLWPRLLFGRHGLGIGPASL